MNYNQRKHKIKSMSKTDYNHAPYGFIEKFFVSILRGFGSSFFVPIYLHLQGFGNLAGGKTEFTILFVLAQIYNLYKLYKL